MNKPRAASADCGPTRRTAERHPVALPGRVTWRDSRGMTRFASVVTRDVSDSGVYLECRGRRCHPALQAGVSPVGTRHPRARRASSAVARRPRAVGGVPGGSLRTDDGHAVWLCAPPAGRAVAASASTSRRRLKRSISSAHICSTCRTLDSTSRRDPTTWASATSLMGRCRTPLTFNSLPSPPSDDHLALA